eukprot:5610_1
MTHMKCIGCNQVGKFKIMQQPQHSPLNPQCKGFSITCDCGAYVCTSKQMEQLCETWGEFMVMKLPKSVLKQEAEVIVGQQFDIALENIKMKLKIRDDLKNDGTKLDQETMRYIQKNPLILFNAINEFEAGDIDSYTVLPLEDELKISGFTQQSEILGCGSGRYYLNHFHFVGKNTDTQSVFKLAEFDKLLRPSMKKCLIKNANEKGQTDIRIPYIALEDDDGTIRHFVAFTNKSKISASTPTHVRNDIKYNTNDDSTKARVAGKFFRLLSNHGVKMATMICIYKQNGSSSDSELFEVYENANNSIQMPFKLNGDFNYKEDNNNKNILKAMQWNKSHNFWVYHEELPSPFAISVNYEQALLSQTMSAIGNAKGRPKGVNYTNIKDKEVLNVYKQYDFYEKFITYQVFKQNVLSGKMFKKYLENVIFENVKQWCKLVTEEEEI